MWFQALRISNAADIQAFFYQFHRSRSIIPVAPASQEVFVTRLHWTEASQVAFKTCVIPPKENMLNLDFLNKLCLNI